MHAISTGTHYHWVKTISASTHGDGVLRLTLKGDADAIPGQFNEAELTIFTENAAMVDRLIAAINGAVTEPVSALAAHECECCEGTTTNPENEYCEFVCDDCLQNRAEAAYERHCSDFHDGGNTNFKSLRQQQIEARRLK